MTQKMRVAARIPDDEFDRMLEVALKEDKKLLQMLAKV